MRASGPWRSAGFGPTWGLGFLERMFAILPLRLGYLLVVGLAPIYFMHHNRPRRAVVRAMRRMGLGLPWWRAMGAYVQYTLTLVDRHYATAGRMVPALERRGDEAMHARLDAHLAAGRPLVILGHHCGALEMGVPALEAQGRVVRAVALPDPGARRLLDNVGDPARSVGGPRRTIVADGSLAAGLRMLKAIRSGDVLAFKADRPLPGSSAVVAVDVFGARVELPSGPAEIARLAKAEVEVVSVFRCGPGRYRVIADPLPQKASTEEMVQAWAGIFARHLRARPDQWFNFFPWWLADRRELAELPATVPPAMRASFAALPGAAAGLLAALLALTIGGASALPALPAAASWGLGGAVALWWAVGFLGGGLDRRARPDVLARTALQASWALPIAGLLAGAGWSGWGSAVRLVVAGVLGLGAAWWTSIRLLGRLDEGPISGGEAPPPPAAPASPDPAPSEAETAPPGPRPAAAPAP
jgi:lauroyl/myristoyl acyltransferase